MARSIFLFSLLGTALGHQLWATKQVLSEAGSGENAKLDNQEAQLLIKSMPAWVNNAVSLAEAKKKTEAAVDKADSASLSREARAEILQARLPPSDNAEWMKHPLDAPHANAGELRPIVQAKVKKVMNYLRQHEAQYNAASEEGKKTIVKAAQDLAKNSSATNTFNYALCLELWGTATQWASAMSTWECPALVFPPKGMQGIPTMEEVKALEPGKLKSAWLTDFFWKSAIEQHGRGACDFMADDVTFWSGQIYKGKDKVCRTLPLIGWPSETEIRTPEWWQCNKDACIVPVKAWGHATCPVYAHWDEAGMLDVVHVNLPCWR